MLSALKRVFLPRAVRPRRILFGPAAGVVMNLDFAHQARMFFGVYEMELAADLRRLVRPGSRCFDVGANVGYHSLMLARLSRQPVVAFEPEPEAAARLQENLALNRFDIRLVPLAVGAADGDKTISLDRAAAIHFVPDFVKIDIEGGEADALAGAARLLQTRRPHLIVETHSFALEQSCADRLRAYGYALRALRPRRFLAETRPALHNGWLVCEGRA
jgi:Methyltransferase FkbM domain